MKVLTPDTCKITKSEYAGMPAIKITHTPTGRTRTIYREESTTKGYHGAYRIYGPRSHQGWYSYQWEAKQAAFAELTADDPTEPAATESPEPTTVTNGETTYVLTTAECSGGTLYTVTGYLDKDGSEESVVDQRFYDNEAAALEFMTAAMVPTALTFTPIEGIEGEYTAPFLPSGFAVNLTKTWRGWSVSTTEHDSADVMDDYDIEDGDGVRWVKSKREAIARALEFAQHFVMCLIENRDEELFA